MVEFGNGLDEFHECGLEFDDASLKMSHVDGDIVGDNPAVGTEALSGSESIAFAGEFGVELSDPPGDVLYFEDFRGRRLPGLEGHPLQIFSNGVGIEGIGFAALQNGGSEVLDGLRIHDGDVDTLCFV